MPDAALTQAEVVDAPEASRYELRLGGRVIGFAAYRRRNDRIVFIHTEVDESYEGRGLGNRLARPHSKTCAGKGSSSCPSAPSLPVTSSSIPSITTSWPPHEA